VPSAVDVNVAPARRDLGYAAEVALFVVSAAAVVGMARLFTDGSFLGEVLLATALAHTIAAVTRALGLGTPATALISGAGLVLFVAWVLQPDTTAYGIPTADTWRTALDDLDRAWTVFRDVRAPVEPLPGFVLSASVGVWLAATFGDWAAFRLGTAFEALAPSFTLFTFTSVLGSGRHRLNASALYVAAALAFLLIQGASTRSHRTAWFASRVRGGPQAIVRGGVVLGAVTLGAALLVGPALPGADDPPLLDWRDDRDREPRLTVSPLVDIKSRLLEQSNVEVFTVESETRSYWRLTSLDSFDGQVWGSKGSYERARGELPAGPGSPPERASVQAYTIGALNSIWLPAAFRPERYAGPGGVSYDDDSGSLLTEAPTSDGLSYRVRSALLPPTVTGRQMAEAAPSRDLSGEAARRYLALPLGFSPRVAELANRIVARAPTPYSRARALQDFLRSRYRYSTEVPPGHGGTAIERFLFIDRRGYCEQFAGTYAAMARAVGLPARVAVGFTPGELQDDERYHVTGRNAHAWPEVFLPEFGWVAFEPTPGRGAPGAEGYTGVPEQQDTSRGLEVTPTTAATAPEPASGGATATTRPLAEEELESGAESLDPPAPSPWGGRLRRGLLIAAGLLVVWAVAVPAAHAARRRRRRQSATSATARTLVAWEEAKEALAGAGAPPRRAETPFEFARRAAPATGVSGGLLNRLAADATAATFAPEGVPEEIAERAGTLASDLDDALRARTSRWHRTRRALDPRPLVGAGRRAD
jgi:transglutaminase-like putative cysteine protease